MKKKLTPEEQHLWKTFVKDVKPLSKMNIEKEAKAIPPSPSVLQKKQELGLETKALAPSPPLQSFGRKERRHVKIEARLDLHGLSLEKGRQALEEFLRRAQAKRYKTVLVITGKGALSAGNTLRRHLPGWLDEPPLRHLVISFHHPAKPEDGGNGAFYVKVR